MRRADFKDLFVVLKEGQTGLLPGATLEQAQTAGAVTINYGAFTNNILAFVLVTIVMFMFIRLLNKLDQELDEGLGKDETTPEQPTEKNAPTAAPSSPTKPPAAPSAPRTLRMPPRSSAKDGNAAWPLPE